MYEALEAVLEAAPAVAGMCLVRLDGKLGLEHVPVVLVEPDGSYFGLHW